ncbi:sugar ABC transporter ATP-binding protein [Actinoallomurus spadix]|uniref:Sugar ABC transporter ATP-binding protein n=1 Tax=Actinoallomurus spadix TaxID=79912 RepID=A0ABN0WM32_9ACTN|nr:sugar ABC transporter ATP-binding protein [Actinoallomurus spadix]MCO5984572.1 sugar ABC transporter ATP-binding protein [Actinoallomurus spadix]
MTDRALEAAGILKTFPGTVALDHVSLTLARGEVHALTGENGVGKSTLVKILSGVHRPDAGRLRRDGEVVRFGSPLDARRSGVMAVHHDGALIPSLSIARNLFAGAEPKGRFGLIDLARMNDQAAEVLAGYGLRVDVRRPLATLDPGARTLVALARAVTAGAEVLILDEPTAEMAPRQIEALFRVVAGQRERGRAVLYVSHRLDELYRLGDRLTVLRGGRVVHSGPFAGLERRALVSIMLGRRLPRVSPAVPEAAAETPADPPYLRATGLTRRHALADVSLELREGEVLGLGGLLGAGRSETAKAIAGALTLDAGQVTVAGAPLRRRSIAGAIRAGVGLLPENRAVEGIIPSLSVRDNIALAALPRLSRFGLVSGARIDRVVETFMRRLRIKATSPLQKVAELSSGNQQKVLLARWLAMQPKVLLLDEPTRGIDVGAKAQLRDLLDELAVAGLAILLISSDLEELVSGCDRVVVLRDGAVAAELTGLEITEERIITAMASAGGVPPADG